VILFKPNVPSNALSIYEERERERESERERERERERDELWVNVRKIESDRHSGNTLHIVKSQ
jgi:hypothetical protein